MASEDVLRKTLKNADGKPFAKYKGLTNNFVLEEFELIIDEVQNDKTGHTCMRVRVPLKAAGFPEDTYSTPSREVALRDLVARRFWESARTHARSPIPKTEGGEMFVPRPGQEILDRGCVALTEHYIEVRFTADLPSSGGKVNAAATEQLIFERISAVVSESMRYSAYKQSKLYNHLFVAENADHIRSELGKRGLVAFVANGSVLPRREDDLAPMIDAVEFSCDPSLAVEMDVPNGPPIVGWGIPEGFSAVVGPSRNGKSVLADAVFAGVYDHIPGDGREYVVSVPDAAFVISEPGRPASSVDLSMFMASTEDFDASSVTTLSVPSPMSELTAISEAVEMGSSLIVMDEEFSNPCVIRKGFMAEDGSYASVSEIGGAMGRSGVSVLMVTGDESAVRHADHVFMMKGFRAYPVEVEGRLESDMKFVRPEPRYPVSKSMDFEKGRKKVSTSAVSIRTVEMGEQKVSAPMAALFDMSQTRALADAIALVRESMDGSGSLLEVCEEAVRMLRAADSEAGCTTAMYHAAVRPMDVAAFLSRHPQVLMIRKGRGPPQPPFC